MADLNYDISVNTSAAIRSLNGLKTAFTGIATGFALGAVVQFADGITNLRNKLMTLTPDLDTVNKQFNAIAAIAITSRTNLESTADLYYRIQRSAKALGISQQEAADITESLAKALTASGQSAGESAGPLLQLGQALQSGVFQGDELRSILEGLPQVAQALAKELGVPVGALKKLGSEGQISADVFVKAMQKAKESIDEAFGRTTPTITSAIQGLKTNAKIAFDEFEKNTQTGKNLAASIEYLGFMFFKATKNIDQFAGTIVNIVKWVAIIASVTLVGRAIMFVAGTFVGLYNIIVGFGQLILRIAGFFKPLGDVLAVGASGLTAFGRAAYAAAGGISALVAGKIFEWLSSTGQSVGEFMDKFLGIGDGAKQQADDLKAYREELEKMKQGLSDTAGESENAANLAKELAKALATARLEMKQQVSNLDKGLKQTQERLALENEFLTLNKDRTNISEGEIAIGKMLTDIDIERRNTLQGLNDQLAKMQLQYSQMVKKDSEKGKELAGQMGILKEQIGATGKIYDQHATGMVKLTTANQNLKFLDDARKRDQEIIIKGIEDQISRSEKLAGVLRTANSQSFAAKDAIPASQLVGLTSIQRQILDIQEAARKAGLDASAAFAANFEDSGDGLTPERAQELATGLDQIAAAYRGVAGAQTEVALANYETARSFSTGVTDAFTKFKEDASDAAKQSANSFTNFTQGIEDAFVKFVQTGKLSFSDLANSIIADLARIAVKKAIVGILGGPIGALFGMAANGGPISGPTIVGERGPELFVPASAGHIISNSTLKGSGGSSDYTSGQTIVNYSIQAVDASSFRSLVARDPSFIYAVTEQGRRSQPTRRGF